MLTREEKKRIIRYKKTALSFLHRGELMIFLMMSIWMFPCSLISIYFWGIDIDPEYSFALPLILFVSIVVALLFERGLMEVSNEFKHYLIFHSSITVVLNVLFFINFHFIYLAFLVAPANAWIFEGKCKRLHIRLMKTKV